MTIDFTCQKCESSFELDGQSLVEGSEKLICPHCEAKASSTVTEDFVAAITELQAQVALLAKKFAVNMSIETDDLEEVDDADPEEEDSQDELDFEDDDTDEDEDEPEDEESE